MSGTSTRQYEKSQLVVLLTISEHKFARLSKSIMSLDILGQGQKLKWAVQN